MIFRSVKRIAIGRSGISPGKGVGRGFTLTELLIVIALVTLMLTMAVPTFKFMSGSNSLQTAQNQISAFLAVARNEAIARHQSIGVLFFRDPTFDRPAMAMVYIPDAFEGTPYPYDSAYPQNTTVLAGYDRVYLDRSITVLNLIDPAYTQPPYSYTYPQQIYDSTGTIHDYFMPFGILWFDVDGQVYPQPWQVDPNSYTGTAYSLLPSLGIPASVSPEPVVYPTQVGLMLVSTDGLNTNQSSGLSSAKTVSWIESNGATLLVNRYQGTLIRCN